MARKLKMNILIVSYDTRSMALAASYRIRKFIKYLLLAGDKVTLITSAFDDFDNEMHGCKVHCVSDKLKYQKSEKYIKRIAGLPDPSVFWAEKAFKYFSDLNFGKDDLDCILISSPPHGIQKFGLMVEKISNAKIICDLRDDFLTNDRIRWLTPLHKFIGKQLESDIVKIASKVVLNTDVTLQKFILRHSRFKDKLVVINNGFDIDRDMDFSESSSNSIVYVGGDYNGFAVKVIEQIASQIVKAGISHELTIITAGPGDWSISNSFDFWIHHGLLDQAKSNILVENANILILLMPIGEREPSGTVPLKAYQYLASNNPIFYYGEKGATTSLLSEFEETFCYQRDEIQKFIAHYQYFKNNRIRREKRNFYTKYSVRILTDRIRSFM
jgi:hypothetical protein